MPAVFFNASLTVSRLRSSMSFSVTTVTDWGMSRNCWRPLPMPVSVARNASLPSGASARSRTVTVGRVSDGVVCAMALNEPASSMAPKGSMAVEAFEDGLDGGRTMAGRWRVFRWDMVATS